MPQLSVEKKQFLHIAEEIIGKDNHEITLAVGLLGMEPGQPETEDAISEMRAFLEAADEIDWQIADIQGFSYQLVRESVVNDLGKLLLQMADGTTERTLNTQRLLATVDQQILKLVRFSQEQATPEMEAVYELLIQIKEQLVIFEAGRSFELRQRRTLLQQAQPGFTHPETHHGNSNL